MMRRSSRAMVGHSASGSRTEFTSPTIGSSSSRTLASSVGLGGREEAGKSDHRSMPLRTPRRGPRARYTRLLSMSDTFTLPIELPDIKRILPHRHPFLLVDRIVELEEDKRVVGIKNVASDERYFIAGP